MLVWFVYYVTDYRLYRQILAHYGIRASVKPEYFVSTTVLENKELEYRKSSAWLVIRVETNYASGNKTKSEYRVLSRSLKFLHLLLCIVFNALLGSSRFLRQLNEFLMDMIRCHSFEYCSRLKHTNYLRTLLRNYSHTLSTSSRTYWTAIVRN